MGRAIWVIFYRGNRRPNPVLVATEVYHPITPLMTTTPMQGREPASIIPPAMLMEGGQQGPLRPLFCLRDLAEAGDTLEASPSRRWFVLSDSHELCPFKKVDAVALTQGDIGFLPGRCLALRPTDAPLFAEILNRPHLFDFHIKERLDRVFDTHLIGLRVDTKNDLIPDLACQGRFLGNQWRDENRIDIHA